MLLAVPNISEGRDPATVDVLASAFASNQGTSLLDVQRDVDHNRSVITLAGGPGALAPAVRAGAAAALERLAISRHSGVHPRIGVLDVAPIVYLEPRERGAACAEALVLADLLASELELPVFLYGLLSARGLTRAEARRGGPELLAARIASKELLPDFGPKRLHPTGGAVLVAARPPLVAFNLMLAPPATLEDARRVAALIREGGEHGLPAVRALGLWLPARRRAQVSVNVEDHLRTPLAVVLSAVAQHASIESAELVGLAPRVAFDGFPGEVPVERRRHLEDVLA